MVHAKHDIVSILQGVPAVRNRFSSERFVAARPACQPNRMIFSGSNRSATSRAKRLITDMGTSAPRYQSKLPAMVALASSDLHVEYQHVAQILTSGQDQTATAIRKNQDIPCVAVACRVTCMFIHRPSKRIRFEELT